MSETKTKTTAKIDADALFGDLLGIVRDTFVDGYATVVERGEKLGDPGFHEFAQRGRDTALATLRLRGIGPKDAEAVMWAIGKMMTEFSNMLHSLSRVTAHNASGNCGCSADAPLPQGGGMVEAC
jgi:hypothetical protein